MTRAEELKAAIAATAPAPTPSAPPFEAAMSTISLHTQVIWHLSVSFALLTHFSQNTRPAAPTQAPLVPPLRPPATAVGQARISKSRGASAQPSNSTSGSAAAQRTPRTESLSGRVGTVGRVRRGQPQSGRSPSQRTPRNNANSPSSARTSRTARNSRSPHRKSVGRSRSRSSQDQHTPGSSYQSPYRQAGSSHDSVSKRPASARSTTSARFSKPESAGPTSRTSRGGVRRGGSKARSGGSTGRGGARSGPGSRSGGGSSSGSKSSGPMAEAEAMIRAEVRFKAYCMIQCGVLPLPPCGHAVTVSGVSRRPWDGMLCFLYFRCWTRLQGCDGTMLLDLVCGVMWWCVLWAVAVHGENESGLIVPTHLRPSSAYCRCMI